MSDNILSDVLFPAGETLRKVASGDIFTEPVGADKGASAQANQRARRNPSGIDMAAEAQKAAQRAGVGKPKAATRDHYAPRTASPAPAPAAAAPFTGKISNND